MANPHPSNPFRKNDSPEGKDPRINRAGQPKKFLQWRKLLVQIMGEPAVVTSQKQPGEDPFAKLVLLKIPLIENGVPVIDEHGHPVMVEHYATNAEMVARGWLRDPKRQPGLVRDAFGTAPLEVDIKSGNKPLQPEMMKPSDIVKELIAILGEDFIRENYGHLFTNEHTPELPADTEDSESSEI